jgi:dihydrofolate reductase
MEIILAYVMSLDGFVTDSAGNSPTQWASPEDQAQFQQLVRDCGLVIMGTNTYESHKQFFKHDENILRIVMTRTPEKYATEVVPDHLEFSSLSPSDLTKSLTNMGYTKALMAGGPKLYAEFFKAGLITDLHVTIEPLLLGAGTSAASGVPSQIKLRLIDTVQLNTRGTLLVRYKVV